MQFGRHNLTPSRRLEFDAYSQLDCDRRLVGVYHRTDAHLGKITSQVNRSGSLNFAETANRSPTNKKDFRWLLPIV